MKAFFSQHHDGTVSVHFTEELPRVAFTPLDFAEELNPFVGSYFVDKFIDFDVPCERFQLVFRRIFVHSQPKGLQAVIQCS